MRRSIGLATNTLNAPDGADSDRDVVLILVDAEKDDPKRVAGDIRSHAIGLPEPPARVICLAVRSYESWFAASVDSLRSEIDVSNPEPAMDDTRVETLGQPWLKQRRQRYSETIDQPRMTSKMNLQLCRNRSPSFDDLVGAISEVLET